MTRVVFVLQEPTPYRTPHLARVAQHPDLDVTLVYAARTVQRRSWTVAEGEAIFLTGPKLPLAWLLHHDFAITPGIWPLLGRLRPDVVVVGGWSLPATQLAIVWCRVHRVPYFLISENHFREPRPGWVRALKRLVLPRLVPHAAGWLVPGSLAKEHLTYYGARPDGTIVFPNTVDVAALGARADALRAEREDARGRLGITKHAVAVLCVGRLVPFKAPLLLVRAAARARSLAETPLHLVLVGDGPLEPEVRAAAAAAEVPISLPGLLEGDELVGAYVAADVFALLSLREPWGVVVNEAMACGLPLVLSDAVGAAADLLEHGGNGLLVRSGDEEGAAAALARLADAPEHREEFGRRSRELVADWGYDESVERLAGRVAEVTAGR